MAGRLPLASHASRRRPLAACVISTLALCAPAAALAGTWTVLNCDGDAVTGDIGLKTGALRFAVANAADGDTVDLSKLDCPNSKISLVTGGHIAVQQPSLKIQGSAYSVLTIDGSALSDDVVADSNLFSHTGNGTLTIQNLALTGGHVNHQSLDSKGGCVYSSANIVLDHVSASSCNAYSAYGSAKGGGVYAQGNLALYDSSVGGGSATAGGTALGGGVYAKGNLTLQFSTLSGNKVNGSSSRGGGARSAGDFLAGYSTVNDNKAYGISYGGGLDLQGTTNTISSSTLSGNISHGFSGGVEVSVTGAKLQISNSTISGNHAEVSTGGLRVDASDARLYNSTIAFNTAKFGGPTAASGVQFQQDHNASFSVILESNVISNNTFGSNESDLGEYSPPGFSIEINGGLAAVPAHNLIRAASVIGLPTDTKSACPMLGSLRDNGGLTKTHALMSHSPAIDTGNDYALAAYDQRSAALINGTFDYLRVSGPIGDPNAKPDIGAYEVQQDDIVFNTDLEGCP